MTVMKKLAAMTLAMVFALALLVPGGALAAGESISMEGSRTITIPAGATEATATLNAVLMGYTTDEIKWESSVPGVVSVVATTTGSSGSHAQTLTGKAPGQATVTAKAAGNDAVLASCTVVVKKSFELSLNSATSNLDIDNGDTGAASLSVTPSDLKSAYDVLWESSDKDIVVVSGSGLSAIYAPGGKVGTATITARIQPKNEYTKFIDGNTVSFNVTVKSSKPFLTMSKDPSSTIKEHGYPGTVTVKLNQPNAFYGASGAVDWSVSDSSVISFEGDQYLSGGVATGSFKTKRNGTATITATMKGSDGSTISESIKITVDKKLPVLDLDGASNMNASQRSLTLTATLDDNDTGTYVGNERIRWEVSHPDHISITSYDSRLSNYKAQVTIRSRYNIEKARVYVYMADNADINHYHTVYVTGLSYLPQTGQDTTILYVVGTLCAAMFLTAGVLYARRKSSQNV